MVIEIMFTDLCQRQQQALLDAYRITSPDEMSWGVVPVTIIEASVVDE